MSQQTSRSTTERTRVESCFAVAAGEIISFNASVNIFIGELPEKVQSLKVARGPRTVLVSVDTLRGLVQAIVAISLSLLRSLLGHIWYLAVCSEGDGCWLKSF
jgi:hypothetical protein